MSEPYRKADARSDRDDRERLDAELGGLAQRGAERRSRVEAAAAADRQSEGHRHLRVAIGSYRGSRTKRTALAILTALALVLCWVVHSLQPAAALAVAAIALSLLLAVVVIMPPLASEADIAAEEQWVASLPFRFEGYFEVLAGTPQASRSLVYDLSWSGDDWPHAALLEDVVGAVDPQARVEPVADGRARIISGPISGWTHIKQSRTRYVTRNHRIPTNVHTLVDRVLAKLHERYPLARVSLTSR